MFSTLYGYLAPYLGEEKEEKEIEKVSQQARAEQVTFLKKIIKHLHDAKASYVSLKGIMPTNSQLFNHLDYQKSLKGFALSELARNYRECKDVYALADNLLSAYYLMQEGVTDNILDKVKEAIELIKASSLPLAAKYAFIDVRVDTSLEEPLITKRLPWLALATRHLNIEMVKMLFDAGAAVDVIINDINVPVFFEVAANVEYVNSDGSQFIPYQTLSDFIHLYLSKGFNLATLFHKKNILDYVIEKNKDSDLKHSIPILGHAIVKKLDAGKILPEEFKSFCQSANNLRAFPVLLDRYTKIIAKLNIIFFQDDFNRMSSQLNSMAYNLKAFLHYQIKRLDKTTNNSAKCLQLTKIVEALSLFQKDKLSPVQALSDYPELGRSLEGYLQMVVDTTKINRLSFVTPTSSKEWVLFEAENYEELLNLKSIVSYAPSTISQNKKTTN